MIRSKKRPFFIYLFAGALVLTSIISVLLGWHILDSYRHSRQIQSRDIKLLDLSWTIFNRNEVLTVSTQMAASSGDPKWEQQYWDFLPQIDLALELMAGFELSDDERETVSRIKDAHLRMNVLENGVFESVRKGDRKSASQLIGGDEYEEQQHAFLTNINGLIGSVRTGMNSTLEHQGRQAEYVAASVIITLPVLLISWLFILNTIRRYISERNTAEASLRRSEEQYRELVESANSIILRMDPEGRVTFFNKFARDFFGYSHDEIYGRSVIGTIVPEQDLSGRDLAKLIENILKDADRFASSENENIRKNGERVWVSWTNRSMLDEHGNLVGVLSIGNDITERKRAEEALSVQYKFLQLLMDTIPSPIFYKDAEGVYQGCNKAFEAFIGHGKEAIIGKSVFDIAPPDLAKKYHAMDAVLFAAPATQIYESSVKYADGTRHDVIFNKASYLDSDGEVAGLVGVMADITDRRRMEEVLRMDEARFEALYELGQMHGRSSREIIEFALERQVELTGSELGFIGFMNRDATVFDLHAWSAKARDYCGMEDKIIHFPVEGAGLWAEAIRNGRPVIENDYCSPNGAKKGCPRGHVPLTKLMSVPFLEEGRVVALVAVANKQSDYDLSDARQLALFLDGVWKLVQRRRADRELQEAERLAAMGRALSSVAHGIKTPLIAIGGFSRLVQNHLEPDSPDRQKLDIVIRETQRLESMIKDMLDFSKPLELQRTLEDINALLAESSIIVESAAREKTVCIEIPASEAPFTAPVDGSRLKQAIVNLVMNAVQASPEGEKVTLRTSCDGAGMVIEISDRGPGIPEEKREEVFSPFFTTKKEGTGLGLPIVRKIIDAHGGQIIILDNPDGGLTFRVEIPIPSVEEEDRRAAPD